jgi:hypothetical protein
MKLQELDAPHQTKQTAKVFESYFGQKVSFDSIPSNQAYSMLSKVRELIKEHRCQPEFHHSEHNPSYLKLIVLEQGLVQCLRKTLKESEIQQAQVVLAAQDIVDQMQKMIEQVTSLQFKDLPALVEQIKNEVGVDQSAQFNNDATAALAGLVQNLQASKQQMEGAVGVVTGQGAPTVPGLDDMDAEVGAELDSGMEPDMDSQDDSSDLEASLTGSETSKSALGRAKR